MLFDTLLEDYSPLNKSGEPQPEQQAEVGSIDAASISSVRTGEFFFVERRASFKVPAPCQTVACRAFPDVYDAIVQF